MGGRVVEAERIVLRDARGTMRAVLATTESGAVTLMLQDPEGRSRAGLIVEPSGLSHVDLIDESGQARASLGLTENGPGLALYQGEAVRLSAALMSSGPFLALHDESNRRRLTISRLEGKTFVLFNDADGVTRGGMAMEDGGPVWIAGTPAAEEPGPPGGEIDTRKEPT